MVIRWTCTNPLPVNPHLGFPKLFQKILELSPNTITLTPPIIGSKKGIRNSKYVDCRDAVSVANSSI